MQSFTIEEIKKIYQVWKKSNFLKSSRPSLLIKRAALGNLKASFHCTHWHRFSPLKMDPPLISVFSPQGRRGKPPSGARNRFALWLSDQSGLRHVVRDGTAWGKLLSPMMSLFLGDEDL